MKWSLYIGKAGGTKIFIHWSFLLLIVWVVVENYRQGSSHLQTFNSTLFILVVFVCVLLHELGHTFTAQNFNYHTRDITLLPIGGMARMDEIPENPKHELLVAVAGPIVNLLIAIFLFPFIYWFGQIPPLTGMFLQNPNFFLFNLFTINIALAVFNLIPAFPMDGGRIFRAFLTFFTNRVKATAIAARTGQLIALGFLFLGILYNPVLAIIGVFIFIMAQAEANYVKSKSLLHDYSVRDVLMKKYFSVDAFDTINDAVMLLLDVQSTDFLVTEKGNVIGTLNRDRIIQALASKGKDTPVVLFMNPTIKFLSPDMPLDKVFVQLQASATSLLPVMENGRLIGAVDLANILEFILIRSAVEKNILYKEKDRTINLHAAAT